MFSCPDLTNDSSLTPCGRVHDRDALPGVMLQENNTFVKGLINSPGLGFWGGGGKGEGLGVRESSHFLR